MALRQAFLFVALPGIVLAITMPSEHCAVAFATSLSLGQNTGLLVCGKDKMAMHRVNSSARRAATTSSPHRIIIRMRGGASSSDDGQETAQRGRDKLIGKLRAVGLHLLEFGVPPALFLYFVVRIIMNPASAPELVTFVTAAAAAMAAESVTFPMDALKARTQLRGKTSSGESRQSVSLAKEIGLLYYGLRAALCRTIPYTGLRMMMYGILKASFGGGVEHPPIILTAMAVLAGITSQLLISPFDLFKVRMQGDAARVRNGAAAVYSSLPQLMYSVAREEGVRGLWTGCKINAVRAAFMNIADQAVTDVVRRSLAAFAWPAVCVQLAVSALTGVSVVLISCPADTVRSKLMNNGPSSPQPKYSGITDTVRKTWAESRLKGFYAAIIPMYLREGPYYFVLWNVLAALRHLRTLAI